MPMFSDKSMKRYPLTGMILVVIFTLVYGYWHHRTGQPDTPLHVIPVTFSNVESELSYPGIIEPVTLSSITSPADGSINQILFLYGGSVHKGDTLFHIDSEKLRSDYAAALIQYVKAKSSATIKEIQLNREKLLYKNKLISDDDFKSKKTEFYNSQLELAQAKTSLENLLKYMDISKNVWMNLTIEDIGKLKGIIQSDYLSQKIKIVSPASGVIWRPIKTDNESGESKSVSSLEQIKSGEILAIVADPNRFVIPLNINELDIRQIKKDQPVRITGVAFQDIHLTGKISKIIRQGEPHQGGITTFPVEVLIDHLSPRQQSMIRPGMSVKVIISISEGEKLLVPIKAVLQKNNGFFVRMMDNKTGVAHDAPVRPGKTLSDSVVIESGLSEGDKIVISD